MDLILTVVKLLFTTRSALCSSKTSPALTTVLPSTIIFSDDVLPSILSDRDSTTSSPSFKSETVIPFIVVVGFY